LISDAKEAFWRRKQPLRRPLPLLASYDLRKSCLLALAEIRPSPFATE
jgi:hypothetical protein